MPPSNIEKLRMLLGDDEFSAAMSALAFDTANPDHPPFASVGSHDAPSQIRAASDSPAAPLPGISAAPLSSTTVTLPIYVGGQSVLEPSKSSTKNEQEDVNSAYSTAQIKPGDAASPRLSISPPPKTFSDHDSLSWPLIGTLAEMGESFCPIIAISKYPYKFVRNHEIKERIADAYFNGGKFWRRSWDLYYVWSAHSASGKPLILIPALQVFNLLDQVNINVKGACLSLSTLTNERGLVLTFDHEHPQLRPRRLGLSTSQEEFKDLELRVPSYSFRLPSEPDMLEAPSSEDLKKFTRMLDEAADQCKSRRGKGFANIDQRATKEQSWRLDLKQTERFLGLHPPSAKVGNFPTEDTIETWEELQAREAAIAQAKIVPPIKSTNRPPYPLLSDVVFICIDLECWERDNSIVTEIGVSTFDTRNAEKTPPREYGKAWFSKIYSRHLRIREKSHLVNSDFLSGCPDDFRFGKSEFISERDVAPVMEACFRPPFSRPHLADIFVKPAEEDAVSDGERTVVIIGHDVANDLRNLTRLGFYAKQIANLHPHYPVIDTQSLFRAYTRSYDPEKLGNVLMHFGITPVALHNAGNDAAYTMQALLAIAVCSANERGEKQTHQELNEA